MYRTTALLFFFVLPAFHLIQAQAPGQSTSHERDLKVRTDLVNIDVLARQKESGRIIGNLSKAANPAGRRVIIVLTSLEASIDFSRRSEKDALQAVLESGAVVSGILVNTVSARIEQGIRGKPTSILRHIGLRAGSLKMFV